MNYNPHLQRIIENAIDFAIMVVDPSGVVLQWNTRAEEMFGWSTADIVGARATRVFTADDQLSERLHFEMSRADACGNLKNERMQLRKDGGQFWACIETMPLRGDDGRLQGYVRLVWDRTQHRLEGERLRQTQDRFQTLLDTVDTAFAIVEVKFDASDVPVDYRFLEANPAFEREAGVNLRGKWVTEFAPELEKFWFETYGRVAWTGEPANFESYAEAFKRWFDVRAIRVGQPEERQIAIFFNDVTARKEAEERLRTSEALARQNIERVQLALAAGAIIGTWNWDIANDRFTVDEGFATTFGIALDDARSGLGLEQIMATVHADDKAGLQSAIAQVLERGGPYAHQYRVRRADGKFRWIEANGRVNLAGGGAPESFPGVLIDVEERRAVQEERDRNAAALRALNETLEQRVGERTKELLQAEEQLHQSQKMEAVGQLTGGLAHDFNNLLAGISGSLEMMETRLKQGKHQDLERYIEVAQTAARRAAGVTHRLLAFSRRQTLSSRPTNVNELIAGLEELVRRTIGPQVQLRVEGAPDLWQALIDPGQLENAILNLCINARDAMPNGGRLTVQATNETLNLSMAQRHNVAPGHYLLLCVADTGVGMTPDVIARVFEPFFTTKPIGQGTGLGLSMIHGFTQQSGGFVSVDSTVGEGTSVCLYLPRCDGSGHADEVLQPAAHGDRAMGGQTIMVVEDEPSIRMLVVEVLEEMGYATLQASDGSAGLRLLQSSSRIDLLITDVGLPGGMNGRQLADAGRERRAGLKVLFITGYAEHSVMGGVHLASGMHLLTKPFPMETFSAKVLEVLGGPPGLFSPA